MDTKLLVRVYNVGLGDCIYLRVSDTNRNVHILIDCGNKFGELDLLGECINDLKKDLPTSRSGKKRLDLLVVSHPHEDHHKGFELEFFDDIEIENLWLSPAFDRLNPKAQGFHALQDAARRALTGLSETALGDMKEEVEELLKLTKDEALEMLRNTLPETNGIQPLYVSADTPQDQLKMFENREIELSVLGPMEDIDGYYLGGHGVLAAAGTLQPTTIANSYDQLFPRSNITSLAKPGNISSLDFQLLRSHMHSNGLAAAEIAGHVVNNLSVVLLLKWHGRRLLFPGDAEWDGAHEGTVQKGRKNGSWNVMGKERESELSKPLDFLKIGHHGSENATPWTPKKSKTGEEHPINRILDALLPLPKPGEQPKAAAIVSTRRTSRWASIPDPALMQEIGRRVANATTKYVEDTSRKHVPANVPQPQRTDLEEQGTKKPVPFIEIEFSPL
jgi:beta-lactamase superfamily II metal-dependent hydrolase